MADVQTTRLVLDGSVLDMLETHAILKEDIKQNRVTFAIGGDYNRVDIFDECRALTKTDNFEIWYDIAIRMLLHRCVQIFMKNLNGEKDEICVFTLSDANSNLRETEAINEYPVLCNWLVEHVMTCVLEQVSKAYENSVASVGSREETERQKDPYNTGDKPAEGGYIVKTYFGDELLYVCYEFYDRFKHKPGNWLEVFDFLRFMQVQGILKDIAMSMAKAAKNG